MKRFFKNLGSIWLIIGVTLLLLILIEIFFKVYYIFDTNEDSRLQADCYQNVEWANEYYLEFNKCNVEEWEPYVYWRRKPFSGEFINVDPNQRRKTVYEKSDLVKTEPLIKIFMLGGSTLWGTGVRDEFTIPSLVGKNLSEAGFNVEVFNFGESGYVNTQEVLELSLQLQRDNIPSLVVFYDGVNDIFSAYQQGKAGIPQNEFNREKEFNSLYSKKKSLRVFFESLSTLSTFQFIIEISSPKQIQINYSGSEIENLTQSVIDIYNQNIKLVFSLAEEYGFNTLFYWQPSIFDKKQLSDYEQQELEKVNYIQDFSEKVNSKLTHEELHYKSLNFFDISEMFSNESTPVFIDFCHISEYGNSIIAERMTDDIKSVFNRSDE